MKEGLENLRRALGEKTADRKDIQQQIISSTTTIQGNSGLDVTCNSLLTDPVR